MKKVWERPSIEILDISKTSADWPNWENVTDSEIDDNTSLRFLNYLLPPES